MIVQDAVEDGPNESRPPKRRKVEQNDPFRPFRLVPSPQEARGLETSSPLRPGTLTLSGGLGDIDARSTRS